MFLFSAQEGGRFKEEIAPVTVRVKKQEVQVEIDEHPRPQAKIEDLTKLPSIFQKNGLVTAGSASVINFCIKIINNFSNCLNCLMQGVCDGAGAVILASEEAVKSQNLKPLARLAGYSTIGVDPSIMGIGPSPAIKNLLKVTGKSINDIDLVEVTFLFIPLLFLSRFNFSRYEK